MVGKKAHKQETRAIDDRALLVDLIERAQQIADQSGLHVVAAHLDSALIDAQKTHDARN